VGRGNPAFTTLVSTSMSRLLTRQLGLRQSKKQLLVMRQWKINIINIKSFLSITHVNVG
jgi:hypothetical protein